MSRAWILVGLVSAATALVLERARAQPPVASRTAAVVNGETITVAEVDAVLRMRPPASASPNETQRQEMQAEAVMLLVDEVVLRQFLQKNGPPADPKEVARRLDEIKSALKSQDKSLADFCRESGQTEDQLRVSVASGVQWIHYVSTHLTDADVQRYYTENRDFFDQVMVQASHIVIRVVPGAPEAERQAGREKLQALRQEIVTGKIDFAEAARKFSQCPSAARGGDIGYFPRKWAVEESFARAAFALQKGEVSGVVETDYGMHLIRANDRKPGQPSNYERIKQEVREIAAEEMRQNIMAQQRKAAKVNVYLGQRSDQGSRP